MTTPHTPPKKEKERPALLANIMKEWYIYAVLLFALLALLYTWNAQLTIEQEIRADYEDYIEQCRITCGGGIQWNNTRKQLYYTDLVEPYGSASQLVELTSH